MQKRSNSEKKHTIYIYISVRQNAVRSGFPRTFTLVFVEIMPDKVILDHKQSYLVSFENFLFFRFLAKMGHKQKFNPKKKFILGLGPGCEP